MGAKYYCDRCNKELDGRNMKYTGIMIDNYSDDDSESEHYMFCDECALSIKQSIVKNIVDYERNNT